MTAANPNSGVLPSTLRLGVVNLVVTDLGRSLAFYRRSLGLLLHWQEGVRAGLGGGREDVIVLHEDGMARRPGRQAGLYHVALLHPSRHELGHALRRLIETSWPMSGASDHGTHDAIYLDDPDGNGLELAADNPREQWPAFSSAYSMGPKPLDLRALVDAAGHPTPETVEAGLVVGHVHLHVGDLAAAIRFYCDTLGFEEQARLSSAAFVSAGGYHHHLAFNLWRGRDVPPAPEGTVGLLRWTIVLDERQQVDEVERRMVAANHPLERTDEGILLRDPWNMALMVRAGTS